MLDWRCIIFRFELYRGDMLGVASELLELYVWSLINGFNPFPHRSCYLMHSAAISCEQTPRISRENSISCLYFVGPHALYPVKVENAIAGLSSLPLNISLNHANPCKLPHTEKRYYMLVPIGKLFAAYLHLLQTFSNVIIILALLEEQIKCSIIDLHHT